MARKANKEMALEDMELLEVLRKAKAHQDREARKSVQQYGNELAMLLCWLQQCGLASKLDEDGARVALASSSLKDHPEELKQALAYYNRLQGCDVTRNLYAFEVGGSAIEGKLWVHFSWQAMEVEG